LDLENLFFHLVFLGNKIYISFISIVGMVVGAKRSSNNSSNKSTKVSAVVRKNLELKEGIFKELGKSDKPLSTSDLTVLLGKAWHTIDRTCLMLQIDGRIDGFKVGKMNLWRLK
jgi:hypothetical protein